MFGPELFANPSGQTFSPIRSPQFLYFTIKDDVDLYVFLVVQECSNVACHDLKFSIVKPRQVVMDDSFDCGYASILALRSFMKAVHALPASAWKPFQANELSRGGRSGRRRKRRENLKRKITIERRPKSWFKGKPEIASMVFRPDSWSEPYRFVIKRTPIIDKDDKQLYLDDGMRKYAYWIVVTNSTRSNTAVLRIAQGRGNQENLIKDFKHGLGLSHVPTGFLAANRAYFLIAALAWNLKTWMLNLLQLGDGAVLRFKRFLYLWICQAGMVATTGRGVLLKLPAGEYYQRFGKAFSRLAALPV